VFNAPRLAPSSWNCTLAIPIPLAALAVTVAVPRSKLAAAGAVMDTVGAWLLTVTETAVDVVVLPAVSLAIAVRLWLPPAKVVVFQEAE
jgi:hypothetical protein